MRPVLRGPSTQATDFSNYRDALNPLKGRLGTYCSYCERRIPTSLAVEHIQPKSLPAHAHLEGRWSNFLLACTNCNATKGDDDYPLGEVLLPDRDNTFVAFEYTMDGAISVRPGLTGPQAAAAQKTLEMAGLNKEGYIFLDDNGKQVAVDRVSERKLAWLEALEAREEYDEHGLTPRRLRMVSRLALARGCFSIWMKVFEGVPVVLAKLIEDHPGTQLSGCFDLATGLPTLPHPNADLLDHGSKL